MHMAHYLTAEKHIPHYKITNLLGNRNNVLVNAVVLDGLWIFTTKPIFDSNLDWQTTRLLFPSHLTVKASLIKLHSFHEAL
jgi:hypothetical protein